MGFQLVWTVNGTSIRHGKRMCCGKATDYGKVHYMDTSTITKKGQTTVPLRVREALKVRPRQRLEWTVRPDGSAVVRPMQSALGLFGSLRPKKTFPGRKVERAQTQRAVAAHAAGEGKT